LAVDDAGVWPTQSSLMRGGILIGYYYCDDRNA
jgi:hypothetical protein